MPFLTSAEIERDFGITEDTTDKETLMSELEKEATQQQVVEVLETLIFSLAPIIDVIGNFNNEHNLTDIGSEKEKIINGLGLNDDVMISFDHMKIWITNFREARNLGINKQSGINKIGINIENGELTLNGIDIDLVVGDKQIKPEFGINDIVLDFHSGDIYELYFSGNGEGVYKFLGLEVPCENIDQVVFKNREWKRLYSPEAPYISCKLGNPLIFDGLEHRKVTSVHFHDSGIKQVNTYRSDGPLVAPERHFEGEIIRYFNKILLTD